jgi:hypothetical protein
MLSSALYAELIPLSRSLLHDFKALVISVVSPPANAVFVD